MHASLDHTGLTTLPVSDELGRVRARRAHDVLDGHLNATSRNVGMGAAETYTWEGLGRKMADVVDNKDKELQKKQEREYIQNCIAEDEANKRNELNKKIQKRQAQQ